MITAWAGHDLCEWEALYEMLHRLADAAYLTNNDNVIGMARESAVKLLGDYSQHLAVTIVGDVSASSVPKAVRLAAEDVKVIIDRFDPENA